MLPAGLKEKYNAILKNPEQINSRQRTEIIGKERTGNFSSGIFLPANLENVTFETPLKLKIFALTGIQ